MSGELTSKVKHQIVWDALEALDVLYVEVEFSGSGDSGSINGVTPVFFEDDTRQYPPGKAEQDAHLDRIASFDNHATGVRCGPNAIERGDTCRLPDLIYDLTEDIINDDNFPDWCNDDGGHGTVKWMREDNQIQVEVYIAKVEYDEHEFVYDKFGEDITATVEE